MTTGAIQWHSDTKQYRHSFFSKNYHSLDPLRQNNKTVQSTKTVLSALSQPWPNNKTVHSTRQSTQTVLSALSQPWPNNKTVHSTRQSTQTVLSALSQPWPNKTAHSTRQSTQTVLRASSQPWPRPSTNRPLPPPLCTPTCFTSARLLDASNVCYRNRNTLTNDSHHCAPQPVSPVPDSWMLVTYATETETVTHWQMTATWAGASAAIYCQLVPWV